MTTNESSGNQTKKGYEFPGIVLMTCVLTTFITACDSDGVRIISSGYEEPQVLNSTQLTPDPTPVQITQPATQVQVDTITDQKPGSPPTLSDITDLVLITGQSNTLGAGTSYDANIDTPNDAVFAFTDKGWQVADLHQVWDGRWFPQNHPDTDPSNNFSLHFGKQVVQQDTSRVVAFILMSAPGQAISHWHSEGQYFAQIRNTVSQAINELPNKFGVDGILWHQGESDGVDDDHYSAALYKLIQDFRSESWFGFGKPFICGETAISPVNRQLNKLNDDSDPSTACIAAEGLATFGDDAHFSAKSLRTIGQRYGDAYLQLRR